MKMIETLNHISAFWIEFAILFTLQNIVFIAIILAIVNFFRSLSGSQKRLLSILGVIKLAIPPFLSIPSVWFLYADVTSSGVFLRNLQINSTHNPAELEITISFVLFVCWSLIVMSLLIYQASLYFKLYRHYKRCVLLPVENIMELAPSGFNKNITFCLSNKSHSPLVYGFFRYKIILPSDWLNWSKEKKRAVVAHELAHVKQLDPLINIASTVLAIFHFFNPLAWLIAQKVQYYSEISCDELAIRESKLNRYSYSKNLVEIAEGLARTKSIYFISRLHSGSFYVLKKRIEYILNYKTTQKTNSIAFAYSIGCLSLLLFLLSFKIQEANSVFDQGPSADKNFNKASFSLPLPVGGFESIENSFEKGKRHVETKSKWEKGDVVLKIKVDEQGNLQETDFIQPGCPTSNSEILKAVKSVKWKPGIEEEKFVAASIILTFN